MSNAKQCKIMKKNDSFIRTNQKLFWNSQILKNMKLTLLFLILTIMNVMAKESYSQALKLSLDLGETSVEQVLKEIEGHTEYFFLFNQKLVDVSRKVKVVAKNQPVENILRGVFEGTEVDFYLMDNQIILSPTQYLSEVKSKLQPRIVSGTVTDQKGEPMIGVTVSVKRTTIGTITDNNGFYRITIPDDAETLIFSFIGMRTTEIPIGTRTTIDVAMVEELYGIQEVVAVGYGTQRRVNLTGAVSTVNFDKVVGNRPLTDASQSLGGNVTGIWVSQNSGEPGKDVVQLRIRGWGTLNNAEPLVIIDGVEGSFSTINPNDVQSITVLKDAASSAIYGSKAANGVVLVTTKFGNYDQKTNVGLSSYYGFQSLGRKYELIDNSAEFMTMWNTALANKGSSHIFPDNVINDFKNNPDDPFKYPNTNFFDHVFRTAKITEHNLSVSGGSSDTKFYGSFNYLNQDGIIQRTSSEKYGIRLNFESRVNNWLTIGSLLNGIRRVSKSPCINAQTAYDNAAVQQYGLLRDMMYSFANGAFPFIAPYTEDGRAGAVQALKADGSEIVENRNPMLFIENGLTQNENTYAKLNAYADIRFTDYLVLKSNFTSQLSNTVIDSYNSDMVGYTDTGTPQIYVTFPLQNLRDNNNGYYYTWFNTLNYNKTLGEKHNVSAIAGMQAENSSIKTLFARRSGITKEGLTQVDAGTSGEVGKGNMYILRMLSYFGRINYSFSDKYLLELNIRADASSRFSKDYRWGVFPGFSAGWRLSEENFIKDLNLFSNLKLRFSWGSLGNQNVGAYWPYLAVISQTDRLSYNYGGTFAPGAAITGMVDETITWEASTTTDVGIDFGLFNNALSIEADYFSKTTKDILVQLPIPEVLGGLTPPFENIGEMVNKGVELNIRRHIDL